MGKTERGSIDKKIWKEAERLFHKMNPTICKLMDRLLGFDSSLEQADLFQQAYLAIHQAVKKYRTVRDGKKSNMKIETFAYWYLEKHFHRTLDVNRVVYDVYDSSGRHVGTYHARDYYQKKSSLPDEHVVKTRRLDVDLATLLNGNGNRDKMRDWTETIPSKK